MYKVQQDAYISENLSWKMVKPDRDLQPNVDLLDKVDKVFNLYDSTNSIREFLVH